MIVDIDAVEKYVRLIASRTGDIPFARHARLQVEQIRNASQIRRKLGDLLRNEVVPETRILRVDDRVDRIRCHINDSTDIAGLEGNVHLDRSVNQRLHIRVNKLLKVTCRYFEPVRRRLYSCKIKRSIFRRDNRSVESGVRILQCHARACDGGSVLVRDGASDAASSRLSCDAERKSADDERDL